jgi:hypothetical protein
MTDGQPATTERQVTQPSTSHESAFIRGMVAAIREPLVHFLILGAAVFLTYARFRTEPQAGEEQIVVSAGKIEHLAAIFSRTWQRPPTQAELQGLIDDYVREEVAYREGQRLGLDQDDTIIRRRIRQKLDFVAEDLANEIEPSSEELAAYFDEHREEYRIDPKLTFRHVYFKPELHPDSLEQDAAKVLAALRSDPQLAAEELGDRTLLEYRFDRLSQTEIANMLGGEFAAAAVALEPGNWHGPLPSAFGYHLVYMEELEPGRVPEFESVRQKVYQEWQHQHRQSLTEDFYQGLLKKYSIVVDWPQAIAEGD